MDERLHFVINQYKDLQYNSFLKDSKSGASLVKANTKAMIDSMRSNASNLIRN